MGLLLYVCDLYRTDVWWIHMTWYLVKLSFCQGFIYWKWVCSMILLTVLLAIRSYTSLLWSLSLPSCPDHQTLNISHVIADLPFSAWLRPSWHLYVVSTCLDFHFCMILYHEFQILWFIMLWFITYTYIYIHSLFSNGNTMWFLRKIFKFSLDAWKMHMVCYKIVTTYFFRKIHI